MKKYLFSILTLLLIFPVMVNAEANIAKIGETEYSTIEAAITAATDGSTITLLGNTNDITVTEGKKVTIDLGGFAITKFVNNGEVTLRNGKVNTSRSSIGVDNKNKMILEDVQITAVDNSYYAVYNYGVLTLKNVSFDAASNASAIDDVMFLKNTEDASAIIESGTYNTPDVFDNYGDLTINGGTYNLVDTTPSTYLVLSNYNYGNLTINGGNFNAPTGTLVNNRFGYVVINNVNYAGLDGVKNRDIDFDENVEKKQSVIDIKGGTFNVSRWFAMNYAAYSTINIYDVLATSTTKAYAISENFGTNNHFNFYGGKLTANSSKGIQLSNLSAFTLGKDDGKVSSENPLIDIKNGVFEIADNDTVFNYFDGKLILKNSEVLENYSSLELPNKYNVDYDKNESYVIATLYEEPDNGNQVADEKFWNEFIEAFKTNEYAKEFIEGDSGITITHTDNSLTVTMVDDEENKTYITKFTYDSKTGIVTYVPIENVTVDNVADAFLDSIWILNTVYVISDIKGYDAEKVGEWLEAVKNPTIAKDGIEFTSKEFSYNEAGEGVSVSGTIEYFTSYKLDIINGLKTFNNTSKPVTNPSTGISFPIIFVLIIVVFGCGVYLIRNKKYFSRG